MYLTMPDVLGWACNFWIWDNIHLILIMQLLAQRELGIRDWSLMPTSHSTLSTYWHVEIALLVCQ